MADRAQYMGPTTSVAHILQKLTVIFGTVVSFNVLMQNFYIVTQGNHEKVPSFVTRLEGTLNQIRLQCPGRMTELEVQQHLKDCLFHRVCKYIQDSIRYLCSTPGTSYSQLMVAAHKAESENEEMQDKVRARAAVTTELGQQIAKLMATLTRAELGSSSASALNSPREAVGGDGQTGVLLAAPAPITAGPVLDRLPWTAAHLQAMGQWLW